MRLEEHRNPKMAIQGKWMGKRRRGRPRKIWMEDTAEDARKLGIGSW